MKGKPLLTILAIFFLMISFFMVTKEVKAQGVPLYSANDILVETIPLIPGVDEEVRVTLNSYSFNLNNYYISWFENGTRKSADYGAKEFVFRTGTLGSVTNVTAVIEIGNQVFRKELRFSPSEVDLLWEVEDGYTPPFYKGKVLPLPQSRIKITAIPQTQLISPTDAKNLIYYWENNYTNDSKASGFGRQSYTIEAGALNFSEKISVTANDRRENSFARNTIDIATNAFPPKILFYEVDENDRVLTQRALNTRSEVNDVQVKLSFHPLHMSTIQRNFTDLFVQWSINEQDQAPQDFSRQNELFISSGGQSGNVTIGVDLDGINKILQSATEDISISFSS